MEYDLAHLESPDGVPGRPFNVVFRSLAQALRRPALAAAARQVVAGGRDVTRALRAGAGAERAAREDGACGAPLAQALSQLTSDDLAVVVAGGPRPLGQRLEEVALLQRYGSHVQLRDGPETALVAARGRTRLRFAPGQRAALRLFPLHGCTEVAVNGEKHVLDFGQDCVRVDCAAHAGSVELEAELPVLVLVESGRGGCESCAETAAAGHGKKGEGAGKDTEGKTGAQGATQ